MNQQRSGRIAKLHELESGMDYHSRDTVRMRIFIWLIEEASEEQFEKALEFGFRVERAMSSTVQSMKQEVVQQ